ncbi:LysR family transcriptional regulator [Parathalassolituus penaei]|uniref:LysR substrate-binding domain-containing protein n=1 Tax=Parathalassolituus penaei TaxID=2997323 RepID=A0A9X3EGV7_9GAMM|nr:LysR family transcriptional regulator [Parathalassolituus penaei]MCY0967304.1 LysR substrate-binding domain-containing protein [Parathalassolituus penaei]
MARHVEPDKIFLKMPSLRAIKAFTVAAKYQNFTRAAEALCVTQAAISRQIRELETHLGVALFKREGRTVELTEAGSIFYDAAYLSFVNIAQSAERIQNIGSKKRLLTICCTPAFSSFWLTHRLPGFFEQNPDIDINLISTENFLQLEPGTYPDVFIYKSADPRDGYHSVPLFHDLVYPVCTPRYLEEHPDIANNIERLFHTTRLNLSPYGRAQVAEHLDWQVWFSFFDISSQDKVHNPHIFNANDYNTLMRMVLNHQGVGLGWHHLVAPLIATGELVVPVQERVELKEKRHFMTHLNSKSNDDTFQRFRDWFLAEISHEVTRIQE